MASVTLSSLEEEELISTRNEDTDRISRLPDDILQEILSFLPTNLSVSTGLLSTRWKNIWKSVPTLHFDDTNGNNKSLKKFINFELPSCQVTLGIHWPLYRRNMEEISIEVNAMDNRFHHFDLLNCESLKINAFSYIKFGSSVSFFRLKILHLCRVRVICDNEIRRVSVSCPVLEELDLSCQWVNIEVVTFLVPTLKKLKIYMDRDLEMEDDQELEIKFLAECLLSLHLTTCTCFKLSLSKPSSLREASLHLGYSYGWIEKEESCMSTHFKTISGIDYLTLTDYTIQELWLYKHLVELRALSSLKFLKIKMLIGHILDGCHLRDFFGHLPSIEALVFDGGLDIDSYDDGGVGEIGESYRWEVESAPQPSLPNLKSVVLSNVHGNKKELGLVKFLLKNASALEKITITSDSYLSLDPAKHLEFSKQLQILSTLATVCLVDFS